MLGSQLLRTAWVPCGVDKLSHVLLLVLYSSVVPSCFFCTKGVKIFQCNIDNFFPFCACV